MNNFVIDTPDNFWQIRWLDKYMEGHKGFIAGGCLVYTISWSIKFNGPLYGRTKQSIRLCFGISPLLDVV